MYGEKSAIICCHLSYLLMDDNGKKKQSKISNRPDRKMHWFRQFTWKFIKIIYLKVSTYLYHCSEIKINRTDAYLNNVTCN